MSNTILFESQGPVATITFNRPDAMNCFNHIMAEELVSIINTVRLDDNIRVVVLKGAGPLFMAGGDIKFFHDHIDEMPLPVNSVVRAVNASIINLMTMPKPVVASVHGSVAGVGVSFMLAADLAIAAEETKFTTAYSGIGACPDGGITYNLPRIVGTRKALELLMLSELFDAKKALEYGIVNQVVPLAQLEETVKKVVLRLANGPTQSLAQIKRLINQPESSLPAQLENEGKGFEKCSASKDFKTGTAAFLNKQRPEFIGK